MQGKTTIKTNSVFVISAGNVPGGVICQYSEYETCVSKCGYFVVTCTLRALTGLSVFSRQMYEGLEAFTANKCIKILSCDQPQKVGCKTNGLETSSISIIEG
jgi:hypothetical protein